jgi:hypothetical protein
MQDDSSLGTAVPGGAFFPPSTPNGFGGFKVVESVHLVEDGWAWLPLGRSGWKAKRLVKVPSMNAVRLNATTLVMHPAAWRELKRMQAASSPSEARTDGQTQMRT